MQANHLKSETETYEEKEQQLVNDCVKELSKFLRFSHLYSFPVLVSKINLNGFLTLLFPLCPLFHGAVSALDTSLPLSGWTKLSVRSGLSSLQISAIAEELARKTEDASRQQEEITHLLSQLVDLQKKAKSVSTHRQTHGLILT